MIHFIHDWKWEPMKVIQRMQLQYATCSVCGKVKCREVLL